MSELFAKINGDFGKVVVVELCHGLVPHAHPEIQFIYWLAGAHCTGTVGDEIVDFSESNAVGVNRYQAHNVKIPKGSDPVTMLMIDVDESWFDRNFSVNGVPISFNRANFSQTCEVRRLCWSVMEKIVFFKENNASDIEEDVRKILQMTVASNTEIVDAYSASVRRKMLDYRIRTALNYMVENMTQSELLKTLPKVVGLSRSRLYELFRIELQSSPKLMLNSVLLDAAVQAMTESEADLSAVSAKLGFSSSANFSRFFRSHKGVTPTSYRKSAFKANDKLLT